MAEYRPKVRKRRKIAETITVEDDPVQHVDRAQDGTCDDDGDDAAQQHEAPAGDGDQDEAPADDGAQDDEVPADGDEAAHDGPSGVGDETEPHAEPQDDEDDGFMPPDEEGNIPIDPDEYPETMHKFVNCDGVLHPVVWLVPN